MINYKFRQFHISKMLYKRIKNHCVGADKQMGSFFEEIAKWFLKRIARGEKMVYIASPQEDHAMTIRISGCIAEELNKIALYNKVSSARVIYTALMYYIDENPL